jgi:hypothetical protein
MFPVVGVLVNSVTVLLYLLIAVYDFYDSDAQELFALSATFLLLNFISIYLHFSGVYINSLLLYLILFFIALLFCLKIFHEKKLFRLSNLKHIYVIFPIGVGVGFIIAYFINFSQFSDLHISQIQALSLIFIMGLAEEIFFRALIQNAVTKMTDGLIAVTFTSILYGLFHFSNNIFYLLVFILLSIVYSVVYSISKNIYIAIGLNIVVHVTFYVVTSHLLLFAIR